MFRIFVFNEKIARHMHGEMSVLVLQLMNDYNTTPISLLYMSVFTVPVLFLFFADHVDDMHVTIFFSYKCKVSKFAL